MYTNCRRTRDVKSVRRNAQDWTSRREGSPCAPGVFGGCSSKLSDAGLPARHFRGVRLLPLTSRNADRYKDHLLGGVELCFLLFSKKPCFLQAD